MFVYVIPCSSFSVFVMFRACFACGSERGVGELYSFFLLSYFALLVGGGVLRLVRSLRTIRPMRVLYVKNDDIPGTYYISSTFCDFLLGAV